MATTPSPFASPARHTDMGSLPRATFTIVSNSFTFTDPSPLQSPAQRGGATKGVPGGVPVGVGVPVGGGVGVGNVGVGVGE
jgi:hypothetical protein